MITAGNTTGSVTVTAVNDSIYETATEETVIVDIDSVTNGTEGAPNQQTTEIVDDDQCSNSDINP